MSEINKSHHVQAGRDVWSSNYPLLYTFVPCRSIHPQPSFVFAMALQLASLQRKANERKLEEGRKEGKDGKEDQVNCQKVNFKFIPQKYQILETQYKENPY